METDTKELDPDIEYHDDDPHLSVPEFVKHANYTIFFNKIVSRIWQNNPAPTTHDTHTNVYTVS